MRVIFNMVPVIGCALLAACSPPGGDKAAGNQSSASERMTPDSSKGGKAMSMDEMAQSAQSMGLKSGTWKVRVEIADIQMKGMPGGGGQEQAIADAMKKRMAAHEITNCITPEQAAKPSAEILAARDHANCTYANTVISGGKIHAEMTCKPRNGPPGAMSAVMDGTYAPEHYSMTMDLNSAGANGAGMTMKSSTVGTWVGPTCAPKG